MSLVQFHSDILNNFQISELGGKTLPQAFEDSNEGFNLLNTAKIDGMILDSEHLVTNAGNPFAVTTGWSVAGSSGVLSIASENLLNTGTGTISTVQQYFTTNVVPVSGHKYYLNVKVRVTNSNANSIDIYIGDNTVGNPIAFKVATQSSPASNTWYMLSGNLELTTQAGLLRVYIVTNYADVTTANGKVTETEHAYLFLNSTLIANKQYSPLYSTTFDLMSDAQIKAQMDLWVQNGTLPNSIMSVDMDKRVTSVGKNLFDKTNMTIEDHYVNWNNGELVSAETFNATDFIKIKPSTSYVQNVHASSGSAGLALYDINKNYISGVNALSFTTPSNAYYLRTSLRKSTITPDTFQLELGTTATTYEPYVSNAMYLRTNEMGYRLPNGVKDTIEFRNGQAYYTQRVKKYTLVSGDFSSLNTTPVNVDVVFMTTINGTLSNTNGTGQAGFIYIEGRPEFSLLSNIVGTTYGHYTNETAQLRLTVPKGTYASLAEAQADLAGIEIYYQLATPIETPISVTGSLLREPIHTIYIDDWDFDLDQPKTVQGLMSDVELTGLDLKTTSRVNHLDYTDVPAFIDENDIYRNYQTGEIIDLGQLVTDGIIGAPSYAEFLAKVYNPYYDYYIVMANYGLTKTALAKFYEMYLDSLDEVITIKDPSKYDGTITTLVDGGRNTAGYFIGDVIRDNMAKIEMSWNLLTATEWSILLNIFNIAAGGSFVVNVTFLDQVSNQMVTREMYVSDRKAGVLFVQNGRAFYKNPNFSLVEV